MCECKALPIRFDYTPKGKVEALGGDLEGYVVAGGPDSTTRNCALTACPTWQAARTSTLQLTRPQRQQPAWQARLHMILPAGLCWCAEPNGGAHARRHHRDTGQLDPHRHPLQAPSLPPSSCCMTYLVTQSTRRLV
jgi:hypothetical protein